MFSTVYTVRPICFLRCSLATNLWSRLLMLDGFPALTAGTLLSAVLRLDTVLRSLLHLIQTTPVEESAWCIRLGQYPDSQRGDGRCNCEARELLRTGLATCKLHSQCVHYYVLVRQSCCSEPALDLLTVQAH